jgi:DNA-binding winged helix-turn-helix (wHTH) protein/tetratricopeptide (TPR) repeat protein
LSATQKLLRFGLFELNLDTEELHKDGRLLKLAPQPFRILTLLANRAGQIVTREEIQGEIWGDETYVDFEHGMNQCIKQIRTALNDNADAPLYVETLPRRGYRFLAPVVLKTVASPAPRVVESKSGIQPSLANTVIAPGGSSLPAIAQSPGPGLVSAASYAAAALPAESEPAAALSPAEVRFTEAPAPASKPLPKPWWNKTWRRSTLAVVLLVTLVAAVLYWRSHRSQSLTQDDTVVLADFINTTGDPVFDDALKTGLSIELQQSSFLHVLSDQKVRAALKVTNHNEDQRLTPELTREVCRHTKSTAMITGTISDDGERYQLQLQALNCQTGRALATSKQEAPNRNSVVATLGTGGRELRRKLGESAASLRESDRPLEQAASPSPEALQAVTRARVAQRTGGDVIPNLKRAIELDPSFASAYAALGVVYHNLGDTDLATQNLKKAYEFRNRTSEQSQLGIEAHYYTDVTGELEKAIQTYSELEKRYPANYTYHANRAYILASLGQYEKAVAEEREGVRLMPDNSLGYSNLIYYYNSLNHIDDSRATFEEAQSRKLESPDLHMVVYSLAFLQGDDATMQEQVNQTRGKPKLEDRLLSLQSDTEAYHGRLRKGRDFSQQATQSAIHAAELEPAATWKANAALREAEVGNKAEAARMAADALSLSSGRNVELLAALTFARVGDVKRAVSLVTKLNAQFPLDTLMQNYSLPTVRAALAIAGNQHEAVDLLKSSSPYEYGYSGAFANLYPAYLRGLAYLQAGQGQQAAVEFQKMLDHPGVTLNFVTGSLAHLQLGRAQMMIGDKTAARKSYQDFLVLWKDADPDVPIFQQAKAEYSKLK